MQNQPVPSLRPVNSQAIGIADRGVGEYARRPERVIQRRHVPAVVVFEANKHVRLVVGRSLSLPWVICVSRFTRRQKCFADLSSSLKLLLGNAGCLTTGTTCACLCCSCVSSCGLASRAMGVARTIDSRRCRRGGGSGCSGCVAADADEIRRLAGCGGGLCLWN